MNNYIDPNEYDLAIINNGCGSEGLKSIIGTTKFLDFIFAPACKWHDFWYSKYSSMGRKKADDMFYDMMIELINKGNYKWYKKYGYILIAKDYYRLVRWYGKGSYSEYDISAILPSFSPFKNFKLKNIECVIIEKLSRWFTRKEALQLGFIRRY